MSSIYTAKTVSYISKNEQNLLKQLESKVSWKRRCHLWYHSAGVINCVIVTIQITYRIIVIARFLQTG